MTAGHCVGYFSEIHIDRIDFSDATDYYEEFQPIDVALHPSFVEVGFRYDVALVRLDRPFYRTKPIRIRSQPLTDNDIGRELTVLGYGASGRANGDFVFPHTLHQATLRYMSNEACREATVRDGSQPYVDEVFDEMMCAAETLTDACVGDSGSPLVIQGSQRGRDELVGLVSWGRGCAVLPGVYSRISYIYDWVQEQLCQMSVDPPSYLECRGSPIISSATNVIAEDDGEVDRQGNELPVDVPKKESPISTAGQPCAMGRTLVTLEMQVDANQTAWLLSTQNGGLVAASALDEYLQPGRLFQETFELDAGQTYVFALRDFSGVNPLVGHYRMYRNEVHEETIFERSAPLASQANIHFGIDDACVFSVASTDWWNGFGEGAVSGSTMPAVTLSLLSTSLLVALFA